MAANVSLLGPAPNKKPTIPDTAHRHHQADQFAPHPRRSEAKKEGEDYFVTRDGLNYAGTHLLIDLWNARHLDEPEVVEGALREAVEACGATLLHIHLHHFSPSRGISGIAVLAESHISIHTWPERDYAAVDIFMCGGRDPYKAIPVLRRRLGTDSLQLNEQKRGVVP